MASHAPYSLMLFIFISLPRFIDLIDRYRRKAHEGVSGVSGDDNNG
jgi:hypothetical protein